MQLMHKSMLLCNLSPASALMAQREVGNTVELERTMKTLLTAMAVIAAIASPAMAAMHENDDQTSSATVREAGDYTAPSAAYIAPFGAQILLPGAQAYGSAVITTPDEDQGAMGQLESSVKGGGHEAD